MQRRSVWIHFRRVFAAASFLVAGLFLTACPKEDKAPRVRVATTNEKRESPIVPGAVAFNGERAMEHVKKQLAIGPRVSGSPELAMTRDYIVS